MSVSTSASSFTLRYHGPFAPTNPVISCMNMVWSIVRHIASPVPALDASKRGPLQRAQRARSLSTTPTVCPTQCECHLSSARVSPYLTKPASSRAGWTPASSPCVQLCRLQTAPTSSAYYGLALRVHPSQCRPVIHILPVRTCSVAPLSAAAGQHGAPSQMARWRGDNVPVSLSGLRSHEAAKDTSEEPPMLTHGQLTWICARSST